MCWIKSMQELQYHHGGAIEGYRSKQVARSNLIFFYNNESTFTFDKYVTKLKGLFNVLDIYGVPLHEEQIVEHLLDQIISPNTELKTKFNICRLSHSFTFIKTSAYLSTVVYILYPTTIPSSVWFIKHGIYYTSSSWRRRRRGRPLNNQVCGRGHGVRGG